MNKLILNGVRFSARRELDQGGEDGYITATDDPYTDAGEVNTIVVGKRLRIGSISGRFLLLSTVQEILEVNEQKTECRIRTRNSVYTIKKVS